MPKKEIIIFFYAKCPNQGDFSTNDAHVLFQVLRNIVCSQTCYSGCCYQWSGIVKYKNKKKTQKDAPKKSKKTKNIMLKKQNVGKNVDQRN